MTPAERARIARDYGVSPDAIPDPQIIPRGVSGRKEEGLAERTKNAFRRYRLGQKLAAADRRNGKGGAE